MGYMEIALLPKTALRIKGKNAAIIINPHDKAAYNAAIFFDTPLEEISLEGDTVVINRPGEYEIGGMKIKGVKNESDTLYTVSVDGVEVLLGKINSLDKMQHKLKEHTIVVAYCDAVVSGSFLTSLATNVVVFYGEKSAEIVQAFAKENIKQMAKYAVTRDKLPGEVETVLLS